MYISQEAKREITKELIYELHGRLDGSKRNVLVPVCPFCGHDGDKYAIYVGPNVNKKFFGMSNCFHCNRRFGSLRTTLMALNLEALIPQETAQLDDHDVIELFDDDEIDDDLIEIEPPKGYKRTLKNAYLKSRGWNIDDYEYFPVGTNRGMDWKLADYVILEVRDEGRLVGYVARNTMSKEDIEYRERKYHTHVLRYKNSDEVEGNGFSKLLYNYDAIDPMTTQSVIICEGAFDVVALNRKLELYENKTIVPIATFGKKISQEQMYKLQKKGVEQVVLGYDNDAKETTSQIAMELENYFDVLIADIPNGVGKDWDEMDVEDIYDVFAYNLKTVCEFNLE